MDCEQCDAVLQDYLDRALDDDRCRQVEAHAARCARCERILDGYRRMLDAASHMPAPPADMVDRIVHTVDATPRPKRRRRRRWVWVAAAVVLLLVIVRAGRRGPQPLPPTDGMATKVDGVLKTMGEATASLAQVGQDLLKPVTPRPVEPTHVMTNLYETSQSLLDQTTGGVLTSVRPIGRSVLVSFGFLRSVPEEAMANGS